MISIIWHVLSVVSAVLWAPVLRPVMYVSFVSLNVALLMFLDYFLKEPTQERNPYMMSPEEFSQFKQAVLAELATVPSYVSRSPEVVFSHEGWVETIHSQQGDTRLVECFDQGVFCLYRVETSDTGVQDVEYYDETNALRAYYSTLETISSKIV